MEGSTEARQLAEEAIGSTRPSSSANSPEKR
jgi:hypothetical protein